MHVPSSTIILKRVTVRRWSELYHKRQTQCVVCSLAASDAAAVAAAALRATHKRAQEI